MTTLPSDLTERVWNIIKENGGHIGCTCGGSLDGLQVQGYPHSGGWVIGKDQPLFWLYVVCPKCGYEWALWKLKVPRDYDFTKPVAPSPELIHAAAVASEVFGDDALEQYAEMKRKLDNTHWIDTHEQVLFGAFEGHPVIKFICKDKIYYLPACIMSPWMREKAFFIEERVR